jgi:hypothetical protein
MYPLINRKEWGGGKVERKLTKIIEHMKEPVETNMKHKSSNSQKQLMSNKEPVCNANLERKVRDVML